MTPSRQHPADPDAFEGDWHDLASAAEICGVALGLIRQAGRAGLVHVERQATVVRVRLDENTTFVLRQIHELREIHGLDWRGIRLVVSLRTRIDHLEREVRRLRDRLP
jgi:hypothetical protein